MSLLKYTYYIHFKKNVSKTQEKVIAHYDTLGFCQYLWYRVDLKAFEKSTISNAPISDEIWCSGNKINALRSSEFCNVKSPTLLGQILTLKKQSLGGDKNCGPTFGWFCVISARGPRLHSKVSDFQSLNVFINFYDEIKDVFLRKNAFFRTTSELPLPPT